MITQNTYLDLTSVLALAVAFLTIIAIVFGVIGKWRSQEKRKNEEL